jgi:chromosomal replication initiation ATPase DnaA
MNIVRSLGITLGEISSTFDRGNSAILNSCRRISKEAETDQKLKGIILEIEEEVKKSTIALIPSST